MPFKALGIVVSIGAIVASTTWWLSESNHSPSPQLAQQEPVQPPAKRPSAPQAAPTPAIRAETPNDNAVAFMLASVAEQYAQTTRYPDYSIPLTAPQAQAYEGNRYHPVALPLEGEGEFTVTLDKFRFTRGEPILVVASLSGRQIVGDQLQATLETAQSREQAETATLTAGEDAGYYQGNLGSDHTPGEYRLIVEAQVDGRPVRHASSLTIEPDLGDFGGLESPFISNNDLVIPVQFDPEEPGYYALSAQLYQDQEPIAQLQAETSLSGSSGVIELRAHGSVLASRELQGNLQLRHLQLRQLPARPGDRTHHAFGPDDGYDFSPPDLDRLRDEPAVNPESEQRAALLRQLAERF